MKLSLSFGFRLLPHPLNREKASSTPRRLLPSNQTTARALAVSLALSLSLGASPAQRSFSRPTRFPVILLRSLVRPLVFSPSAHLLSTSSEARSPSPTPNKQSRPSPSLERPHHIRSFPDCRVFRRASIPPCPPFSRDLPLPKW